jgi:hypothetical protein
MASTSSCNRGLKPAAIRWFAQHFQEMGQFDRGSQHSATRTHHSSLITHHSSLIRDLLACLLLILLTLVFVWQVAWSGYLPNSTDFVLQYYPNLAFLGNSLKAREIPLWNPLLFAGTPYLADPQSQLLYLPNWPFLLLLDTARAARAILLAHFAFASIAMYAYLRTIRLPRLSAFLGGAVYGLGPYAIEQVAWAPVLMSLAWMPLVLLLVELSLQRRNLLFAALAAAALAMQFFNGWPHGSYMTAFLLLATVTRHGAVEIVRARSWRPVLPITAIAASIGALAVALCAPVWLPFLEYWGQSTYITDRGLEAAGSEGSITALALLGIGGSEGHGAYVGITALVLVVLGVLYSPDKKRAWMFVAVAAFGLAVAFGSNAPLYGYLYQWVPGFRTFHMPGRFMVLFVFSASVLAAMGSEALLKIGGRRLAVAASAGAMLALVPFLYAMVRMLGAGSPRILAGNLLHPDGGPYLNTAIASHVAIAGIAAVLFLLALASNRLPRSAACYLAIALALCDIFLFQGKDAHYFSPSPAILRIDSPAPAIQQITAGDGPFRVAGFQQNGTINAMSDFPFNLNAALVPPNLSLMFGLEDLQGYLPLQIRRYAEYVAAINEGPQDYHWAQINNFQSPLLDLLNLRYIMLRDNDERLTNVTIATNLAPGPPGHTTDIKMRPLPATGLQVDSYLGNAVDLEDGHVVARVKVTDTSGQALSFDLRAGIETAEWAYDRPDIAARVQHHQAPIAMTRNLPSPTHVYVANLVFPRPITISNVTIEQIEPSVQLAVPEVVAVPVQPVARYEKAGELNGATLYRNRLALPRALMVPTAEIADTPEQALQRLQSPDFDPRQEVVLEGPPLPPSQAGGAGQIGQAPIRARGDNSVQLTVRASSPGFLVLNELSYPGWNAYLDGKRVTMWRANYLFRAIEVPPGEHDVEFRFEPDSLKLGLTISLSSLALLLLATAALRLKSRKQRKENIRR